MPRNSDLPNLNVTTGPLPASRKVYVSSSRRSDVRVAMREVSLTPGAGADPVRVYDTSGPYTDPDPDVDIRRGLPELRRSWIEAREDVERYTGRSPRPEDDGLRPGEDGDVPYFERTDCLPLRGKNGRAVTQLA